MSSTHAWIRHAVSLSFSFVFVFLGSDSVVHATLPLFVHLPSSSQACIVGFFYPPAHHVVVVVVVRLLLLRWFLRAFGCFVTTTIQAKPRKVSLVSGGGAPPHHAGCRERKGEGWEPIPACTSQTTVHNPPLLSSPIDRSIDGGGGGEKWDPLREMGNRDDAIHPRRGRGPRTKANHNPRRTIVAHRLDASATMQIFVKTRAYHDDRTRDTNGCTRRKKEEGRGRDVGRRNDARKEKRKEGKKRGEVAAWGRC